LVEHDLAKVGVAGSSPVFRSESRQAGGVTGFFLENSSKRVGPGGGIGRHAGLKILFAATRVRVQFPPGALDLQSLREIAIAVSFCFYRKFAYNLPTIF
jgi:hypothetical protein